MKKVVVLGGGTGTYAVLAGLKKYPLDITAIVSMADSGGSAQKERDEWGLLPVSDVRKALIALAPDEGREGMREELLRDLFNYRFSEGVGMEGTTFGNLFLVALSNVLNSQDQAIEEVSRLSRIKGRVLPVTLEETNLVAEYEEGVVAVGEHAVDEPKHDRRLAIRNVYTSLLPALLVEGIAEAIKKSKAEVIFVQNLMSKFGQTNGFSASRYLSEIGNYSDLSFNHVLVNTASLPEEILRYYATSENSYPIEDDLGEGQGFRVLRDDFLSRHKFVPQKGDKLNRSVLRHDPKRLAKSLMRVIGK